MLSRNLNACPFRFNGLSVDTLLLSVVSFELRRLGVRHVRYLDDFLYIGRSERDKQRMMQVAAITLARFGLVVNQAKTVAPIQDIIFLGVSLDSRACCLYVTADRVLEVKQLCALTASRRSVTSRDLQRLVGKMSFCATVLPGARPFLRRLIYALNNVSRHSSYPHDWSYEGRFIILSEVL